MDKQLSESSLDRYHVIALVKMKQGEGKTLRQAIFEVTKEPILNVDGKSIEVTARTIYRWIFRKNADGLTGLCRIPNRRKRFSTANAPNFVEFVRSQKDIDGDASLPEIIRRAEVLEIVKPGSISRTSLWRLCRRENLPMFRDKRPKSEDMRRFAKPHRMMMVLVDGKHFRAGPKKVKRVVLFFLDDSTRKVISCVVGKSETSRLMLRGLYEAIREGGLMEAIFLDRGSGFTARRTLRVCANLDINLIHGRARYPPGRGKIERFNQTVLNDLLRGMAQDLQIDARCESLEYQINEYIKKDYNTRVHTSLEGLTPNMKWDQDSKDLEYSFDAKKLEDFFEVSNMRSVARDNVVMIRNIGYEVPQGYAGKVIEVFDHVLRGEISIIHEGRRVVIQKVDLHANARMQRRKKVEIESKVGKPFKTSAQLRFDKDHRQFVGKSGDFFKPKEEYDDEEF